MFPEECRVFRLTVLHQRHQLFGLDQNGMLPLDLGFELFVGYACVLVSWLDEGSTLYCTLLWPLAVTSALVLGLVGRNLRLSTELFSKAHCHSLTFAYTAAHFSAHLSL